MSDGPEEEKPPGLTVTVVGTGRGATEIVSALAGRPGPLPASDPSGDPVDVAPTIVGPHGRAWSVDPVMIRVKHGIIEDGQVANWVVEAPWAHPLWHSYWIALVHLRPFPGMSGGTHLYIEGEAPEFMTPMNFGAQLREPGDALAAGRIETAVRDIVEGCLNPDTDALSTWQDRFGDNMMKHAPGHKRRYRPGLV